MYSTNSIKYVKKLFSHAVDRLLLLIPMLNGCCCVGCWTLKGELIWPNWLIWGCIGCICCIGIWGCICEPYDCCEPYWRCAGAGTGAGAGAGGRGAGGKGTLTGGTIGIVIGGSNSSISWQYLPVKPFLHVHTKSGLLSTVLVVIQVPPAKHGLFAHESGKKQFGPVAGLQHSPVRRSQSWQFLFTHTQS